MSAGPSPHRGEIWYASTPGQPDDHHRPRPVLIVSEDVRNRLADDIIVIPAFSSGRLGPTRVVVPAGLGGMPRDSVLFCEEVTRIDRDFLRDGPLGPPLPNMLLVRVIEALVRAVGG
jgi:mRNA interferase MazF